MRIQHNISAMNSYRNFSANNSNLSKNLEKLSTGYKINRAGDDAAGLAISEKMRAQITGLEGATKNAKDGISLIQTAEGALTEVHSMLNRMTTLAEQSANGTYDDSLDRQQLQKEVDALKSEIDRIADSTNYNGIKLLDGSLSGASNVKGGVTVDNIDATYTKASTGLGLAITQAWGTGTAAVNGDKLSYTVSWKDKDGNDKATTVEFTVGTNNAGTDAKALVASDGTKYNLTAAGVTDAFTANGTGDFQKALLTELNKDAEFSANFKATTAKAADISTADGGTAAATAGGMLFTSKGEGTEGAVIQSVQVKAMTKKDDGTYSTKDVEPGTIGTVTARINGKDASQELKLDNIRVLQIGDETETDGRIEKNTFEINGKKFALMAAADASSINKFQEAVGSDVTLIQLSANQTAGNTYAADSTDAVTIAAELSRVSGMNFAADGTKVVTAGDTKLQTAKGKSLDLQIGDTADSFNKLSVNVKDMHVASIGVADVDISDQEGAAAALDKIKTAINNVSDQRGSLGALQNRLDHTLNNLGVMRENIQNAESLIRDTDIAEEMMAYTKNNILNQSAQAMLALANQLPQGVLQLLG